MNTWLLRLLLLLAGCTVAGGAEVTLTWRDNSDNEQGFHVERSVDGSGVWVVLATLDADTETYVDKLAQFGVRYAYRVDAYNAAGKSDYSPWARILIPPAEAFPAMPGGLSAAIPLVTRLTNVSARVELVDGSTPLIGGFVITGDQPLRVLVRGIGPALADHGIENPLLDPKLEVFDSSATLVASNLNWTGADVSGAALAVGAFALLAQSLDAALLVTLPPGAYTVHVTSEIDGHTGVALFEAYAVP